MSIYVEQWENRVERNINESTQAPWLDAVPELDTSIIEMSSGSASEKNKIHIPTTDFEPDVLINNTTYPIALQDYTDSDVEIQLDKFQTKATTLSDDQIDGSSYQQIDVVTASHTEKIRTTKHIKAAHAMAPAANTAATPVVLTLGLGTEASGERLRCTYESLVNLKDRCDKATPKVDGDRILVLCDDHFNDLLLDRKNFGDQLVNYQEGKPAPRICGFLIYRFKDNPYYNATALTKLAYGAVPSAGQYQGSFVFVANKIAKKTGKTKMYFSPAQADTETQTNKMNFRHYFICVPKRNQHIAALVSKNKA
ncbi:MAG: hypothetical protein ACOVQ4_14640 [Flectobacillus sp.]|uniref:phage major capsid protein n=1 Tax=Flectobacillus sp. TaxID=50419 RepID=UPI003B99D787